MRTILEHVDRGLDKSIPYFEWSDRVFACPYHIHPEIELNYIVSSYGHRLVGDSLEEFRPGDLVLLGARLPHTYFHKAPPKAPRNWARSIYIQFLADCLGREFFELPEMTSIRTLLARAGRGIAFTRATAKRVLPQLQAFKRSAGIHRISLFLEILKSLADAGNSRLLASAHFELPHLPQSSRRLELATAYINRHLFERLTLPATAHEAHMSPQGFSRFFHQSIGRTFESYVTELRIGSACQRLLETDLSVAEICFATGFNNVSNFNRHFRKLKHMSPREFRRRCVPDPH